MDLYNNPPNPTKFYTNFLYKATFLSIFMLILPLLPWQETASWELLQLVFVGIAVSYGLFSKRNDEPHKKEDDQSSSYVARLLQVSSSVFDDDHDSLSSELKNHKDKDKNNVQSWNSQYFRGEPPLVVVAKESDHAVSSLKNELINRSSNPFQENNNIVLRSPVPWRSRSGRIHHFPNPISTPPPPPPPPPPPTTRNIRRSVTRVPNEGLQNRARKTTTRSLSDGSRNEYYLSHDKEIERFIETRRNNNKKKESMDDEEDEEINAQTFTPEQQDLKTEFVEKDSDEEDEEEEEEEELQELASKKNNGEIIMEKGGPDVDKKADEFIAKFREQIRLQRIASIRTSTSLTPKNLNNGPSSRR